MTAIKPRVKAYLASRDCTAAEVAEALGISKRQAIQALSDMKTMGGAVRVGKSVPPVYASVKPVAKADGKRTIPVAYHPAFEPMTEDNYSLYAGRDLAMLAR